MQQLTDTELRQRAGMLMSQSGAMAYKAALLSHYGVERIRDLTTTDLLDLIARLEVMAENKRRGSDELRKKRSAVLYLLDDLGVKAKEGGWDAVNKTLLNPKIAGKLLYEMNVEELKACALRLRMMLKKRAEKDQLNEHLAKNN